MNRLHPSLWRKFPAIACSPTMEMLLYLALLHIFSAGLKPDLKSKTQSLAFLSSVMYNICCHSVTIVVTELCSCACGP